MVQKSDPKLDKYVCETFVAYTRNKEYIMINFDYLRKAKELMYKLIVHSIKEGEEVKSGEDKTNLLLSELPKIFSNIKSVHIAANNFSFSLIGFLSVLTSSEFRWQTVTIRGKWICDLLESPKASTIEKQFNLNNYNIVRLDDDERNDAVIITLNLK